MVLLLGHSKTIRCFKCDLIPQLYDSMILLGTKDLCLIWFLLMFCLSSNMDHLSTPEFLLLPKVDLTSILSTELESLLSTLGRSCFLTLGN